MTGCVAVPYKLLLYGPGQHFAAPHKDSEKADRMFGTLIVEYASACGGGELTVSHKGTDLTFFGDVPKRAFGPRFAAFYADCMHRLSVVTSGYRLAMSYSLCSTDARLATFLGASDEGARLAARLADALDENQFRPTVHEYTESALSYGVTALKGADARLAGALCGKECQSAVEGLQLHVATIKHEVSENGSGFDYDDLDWELEEESTVLSDIRLLWAPDNRALAAAAEEDALRDGQDDEDEEDEDEDNGGAKLDFADFDDDGMREVSIGGSWRIGRKSIRMKRTKTAIWVTKA
jgi:hypothetical protein